MQRCAVARSVEGWDEQGHASQVGIIIKRVLAVVRMVVLTGFLCEIGQYRLMWLSTPSCFRRCKGSEEDAQSLRVGLKDSKELQGFQKEQVAALTDRFENRVVSPAREDEGRVRLMPRSTVQFEQGMLQFQGLVIRDLSSVKKG